MPRPPNTDERRAQIAASLLEVMSEHGYDGASITRIAEAAGLTSGLIHYHFTNKQQILLAALDVLVEGHRARLEAHLTAAPDNAPARVAAFIDLHLGLGATADPEALACWIFFGGEALRQEPVQTRYAAALEEITSRLAAIITAGLDQGTFHCRSAAEAACAIVATIQGYFVLAATARRLVPPGSAARTTTQMAAGLLGCELPLPSSEGAP